MSQNSKLLSLIVLAIFLISRFGLDHLWRTVHPYYSYLFEFVFVGICFYLFRKRVSFRLPPKSTLLFDLGIPLVAGLVIHLIIQAVKVPVPFQFDSLEIIILLLIVAPLLEELIFRMALWEALKNFSPKPSTLIATSAFLFSLSHILAYWAVPEIFQAFVILQAIYTIFLGLICGLRLHQSGSTLSPIFVHFAFNLGFWIASQIALFQ